MSTTASFAGAAQYSTIAFAPILTNLPVASNGVSASNLPIASTSAVINGNTATFPGYSVIMRTGYTDPVTGAVLGQLIVRARACRAPACCPTGDCAQPVLTTTPRAPRDVRMRLATRFST